MTLATTSLSVWYLMRGSGLVALVLFSVAVALGVVGVRRWQSSRWSRLVTSGLHRNVALVATLFLAIHVVTAVMDRYIGLSWLGTLVPFHSTYRPLWVGLGVIAFDLVLAVTATSLLRRRLHYRTWRYVHFGTWIMWPIAVGHALGAGTDRLSFAMVVTVACLALVGSAAAWRLWPTAEGRPPVAPARPVAPVRRITPAPPAPVPARQLVTTRSVR